MGKGEALIMELARHSKRRGAGLCFAFLCMLWLSGAVMALTQGEQYLNEKEDQLARVAEGVRNNDARKCELLKTCTSTTCSRNTCLPGKDDVIKYSCVGVSFNKYCDAGMPKCTDKTFDYTRSSVRTAINTDFSSTLTTIGTCAQRALDPVFQNLSTPKSDLLRIYFGSNDGSFRAYPGSDQDVNDPECSTVKYDLRLRPWYRASTSVPKVIVILVDAGQSMNRDILRGLGSGTLLENANIIIAEFLKSLDSGDFVNIIMFNSTEATPLSSTMVQVQMRPGTTLPALDLLTQSLAKQTSETLPGTSDVVQGINVALQNFGTDYLDAAKIILIFTDMEFTSGPNTSIPVANLTALNVKVFVYKIPPTNDDKLFIGNSDPFANQLCSIGGSFEVISRLSGLSNPLLALNSFFTFTAALHAKVVNNSADFSPVYAGYEQIEGNITTASIPVFGADKMLLGVVGLDIFINKLGSLADSVQTGISTRSVGKKFKTSNFLLTRADCSLQTELPSTEPCNMSMASILNGGFCPRTDQTSKITDLACCRSCKRPGDGGGGGNGGGGLTTGAKAGIAVGCVVALILSCAVIWYFCFRGKDSPPVRGNRMGAETKPFPGGENGVPLQATQ